jgi:hypothetical protein
MTHTGIKVGFAILKRVYRSFDHFAGPWCGSAVNGIHWPKAAYFHSSGVALHDGVVLSEAQAYASSMSWSVYVFRTTKAAGFPILVALHALCSNGEANKFFEFRFDIMLLILLPFQ